MQVTGDLIVESCTFSFCIYFSIDLLLCIIFLALDESRAQCKPEQSMCCGR